MNKKMFSLLLSFMFSFFTCKAIEIEICEGDISYIVNTQTNKATIRGIYFRLGETKDVVVPSTINWCGQKYIVTGILDYVIKDRLDQISSVVFPGTFEYTSMNRKALELLAMRNIPVIIKKGINRNRSLNFRCQSI